MPLRLSTTFVDYCVRQTVLGALQLGFEVVVVPDAVRAVDGATSALADMEREGARVIPLGELAASWSA